jgi:hypothetical protein
MIRICYRCHIIMGEKKPYEDLSLTHGLCDVCFDKEMKDIKETLGKLHAGPGQVEVRIDEVR